MRKPPQPVTEKPERGRGEREGRRFNRRCEEPPFPSEYERIEWSTGTIDIQSHGVEVGRIDSPEIEGLLSFLLGGNPCET